MSDFQSKLLSAHPMDVFRNKLEIDAFIWRERADGLFRYFRHCAVCASPGFKVDLLCDWCGSQLDSVQNRGVTLLRDDYPFPVYSLFTWDHSSGDALRSIIYGLKRGMQVRAFKEMALKLSYERRLLGSVGNPIFVIPPRQKQQRDHAWVLAESLARLWQAEIWDGFSVRRLEGESGVQKHRSREERSHIRFVAKGTMNELQGDRTIVFVDDLITTGATAFAAYMALGDPSSFEVWTLVNRPKLAGLHGL